MKTKAFLIPLTYLLLSAALLTAIASGGDSSDPLVSLSYLNGTYTSTVSAKIEEKLDASDLALEKLASPSGEVSACAETWTESRLKERDVLSGSTGLNVLVLAGGVTVSFPSGTVIDVTEGTTPASGTALKANHRYLVAEDTAAEFTVASPTAVVDYMGRYAFSYSNAVDYNAIASALKAIHLFRGSYTGYGSGYDLEAAPTRLQALIMFIRVLGEEDAALAYGGSVPFTDLTAGSNAAKYVGYAYEKGYTNGYTATLWKPSQRVNVRQYTEFMLRALGYSSAANTDLSGTMANAQSSSVLTAGEVTALTNASFLRAQLVYISYYALDAALSGSAQTLRDSLCAKGIFTSGEYAAAAGMVSSARIG